MATKTNSGLLEYAKAQVGLPYWYGCYGQTASASVYETYKKMYPSYYTASDFSSQYGKRVHDCVGLIKGYLWSSSTTATPVYNSSQDVNAAGMYSKASTKGKIATLPSTPGILVFRGTSTSSITHIGVYDGSSYVYEAKGHSYGVVKSTYSASNWDYWAQCPYTTDDTSSSNSSSSSSSSSSSTSSSSSSSTSSGISAGTKLTLSKTKIYSSATTSTSSGTKTGTYYAWDNTQTNSRIRITNKSANVGVSGQVTGWVALSDVTSSSSSSSSSSTSSSSSSSTSSGISAGTKLTLSSTKLYASSTTSTSSGSKSGTYYAWDDTQTNGRIRITTKTSYVGVSGKVTGWVNVSDVTSSTGTLTTGGKVTLSNTKLYASSTSTSASATKSGTYYIWSNSKVNGRIRITTKTDYVGVSGKVTGWVNVDDITIC